jgi:hypothetical protein
MLIALKILLLISVLIFLVGLMKPGWIVFWMKQPDRLSATTVALLLFMAAWTGIAKLTMPPRELSQSHHEESREERNQLPMDSR